MWKQPSARRWEVKWGSLEWGTENVNIICQTSDVSTNTQHSLFYIPGVNVGGSVATTTVDIVLMGEDVTGAEVTESCALTLPVARIDSDRLPVISLSSDIVGKGSFCC